ncbi:MAG: hypothetical protein K0Q43_527 [Ramlibacter sp.]|jgi:hypothetical protein|nr:hypothetical protein [Ramlibacter sp.]
METLKDVFESLRDWFKTRFTNPLFAAFVIAWLAMNWRVVLALFSDVPYRAKVEWIDFHLYPEPWHWPAYGFVFPMLVALFYVAFSPPIFRRITTYYRKEQHKSAAAMLAADAIKPISPDEAQRIIKERVDAKLALRGARAQFTAAENDYIDQIAKLQASLDRVMAGVGTGAIEPAKVEEQAPSEADTEKRWRFTAQDFDVAETDRIEKLIIRGVSQDEANVLHHVRNTTLDSGFVPESLPDVVPRVDRFRAALIVGRLKNLLLIQDAKDDELAITTEGMQAVDALLRRGFVPDVKERPAAKTTPSREVGVINAPAAKPERHSPVLGKGPLTDAAATGLLDNADVARAAGLLGKGTLADAALLDKSTIAGAAAAGLLGKGTLTDAAATGLLSNADVARARAAGLLDKSTIAGAAATGLLGRGTLADAAAAGLLSNADVARATGLLDKSTIAGAAAAGLLGKGALADAAATGLLSNADLARAAGVLGNRTLADAAGLG